MDSIWACSIDPSRNDAFTCCGKWFDFDVYPKKLRLLDTDDMSLRSGTRRRWDMVKAELSFYGQNDSQVLPNDTFTVCFCKRTLGDRWDF